MSDANSLVLLDVKGAIATVTLNRPERRNSITNPMLNRLSALLKELAKRDDIRVVVLRGAGHDFCPGADIQITGTGDSVGTAQGAPLDFDAPVVLHTMPQVTVAAVDGGCAGAGLGWACACDLRVATPQAVFNTAFLDVGVAGDMGGPWTLPRIVGPAKARELYFLPGKFDAETALGIGLVSKLIPRERFANEVDRLAQRLAAAAPLALRGMKANFLAAEQSGFADFVKIETRKHIELFTTEDTREAFAAKRDKRAPVFKGR
jgi:2-(1,2-epoxy-1,2-dihydrophenyl)acetyl-CoA isomerase